MLFLALLTSCKSNGLLRADRPDISNHPENAASADNGSKVDNTSTGIGAPVAIPPQFGNAPKTLGNSAEATGLPSLQPMKGVNIESLFAERIKDSDKRFDRLENAVIEMRKEFESVKPSIIRLVAVETDMQNLTKELESLLQETPDTGQPMDLSLPDDAMLPQENATLQVQQLDPQPPSPITSTPQPLQQQNSQPPAPLTQDKPVQAAETPPPQAEEKTATEKPQAAPVTPPTTSQKTPPPAPAKASGNVARNFRIGEHADKIRIVIDTGGKPSFTVDYDSSENLIIVEIENMIWEGNADQSFSESKLVSSYSVTPSASGNGSTIAISLKKETRILTQKLLSPDDNPNYRIYFDLAP